ncbi:protein of unknown function [Paraburkholderia kururiensis]
MYQYAALFPRTAGGDRIAGVRRGGHVALVRRGYSAAMALIPAMRSMTDNDVGPSRSGGSHR